MGGITLPYNIVDGNAVDATPVMANFNTLQSVTPNNGGIAAAAGANSDITSLSGLTTPLSAGQGGTGGVAGAAMHNCQFRSNTATQCVLYPYGGNQLTIAGVPNAIPSAGVALSNSGLTASTFYYVYAYMSGGSMALIASPTGWVVDSVTGMPVMSGGGNLYTLVGAVYMTAGAQFQDTPSFRGVLSYFNRRRANLAGTSATVGPGGASTPAELSTTYRAYFIEWADTSVELGGMVSSVANNTLNDATYTALWMDGAAATGYAVFQAYAANTQGSQTLRADTPVSEGNSHYLSLAGFVTSGSAGTWSSAYVYGNLWI